MAKVTLANVSGERGESYLTVKITVSGMGNGGVKVKLSHYLSGNPNGKTYDKTVGIDANGNVKARIDNLTPGREYVLIADYTITEIKGGTNIGGGGSIETKTTGSASTTGKTLDMTAAFNVLLRTPSTINTQITYPAYGYGLQFRYSIKEHSKSEWAEIRRENIEAGKSGELFYLFVGLKNNTSYDIMVKAYRANTAFTVFTYSKTYTATTTTSAYTDGLPYIHVTDYVSVPGIGKGIVTFGLDKPLGDGYKIYLYKKSGSSFIEDEEITNYSNDTLKGYAFIEGTAGSTDTYKIGIKATGGGVSHLTEEIPMVFKTYSWTDKVQGAVATITASEMRAMADAVLAAAKYTIIYYEVAGTEPSTGYIDTIERNIAYLNISYDQITQGKLVRGGEYSVLSYLATLADSLTNPSNTRQIGSEGASITALTINSVAGYADDALGYADDLE